MLRDSIKCYAHHVTVFRRITTPTHPNILYQAVCSPLGFHFSMLFKFPSNTLPKRTHLQPNLLLFYRWRRQRAALCLFHGAQLLSPPSPPLRQQPSHNQNTTAAAPTRGGPGNFPCNFPHDFVFIRIFTLVQG